MNIPNGDMVGHTGDVEATVVACKAADEAVKVNYEVLKALCILRPNLLGNNCYML